MNSLTSHKRIRSSDHSNDDMKKNARSSNLVCLVCGAPAIGFNFSVITCMCCKAFFRRNALYGLEAYQCRYLTGNCSINLRTRRDCSYCRLHKCFDVGMKKELILTDDVKRLKREKIQANRQLTLTSTKRTGNLFQDKDSSDLIRLSHAYEEQCRLPIMTYEKREYELTCRQPVKSRIKFQHYLESYQVHRQAIEAFFQHIPEFQTFPQDEQKILFTHNHRFLMRINSIETIDDSLPLWGAVHLLAEVIFGKILLSEIDSCLHQFKHHIDDSKSIQLLLIIMFFSTSTNYTGHLNTLILYRIQEKYTDLLWSYLKQRYGELLAYEKMSFIIRYCLRLQTIDHIFETRRKDTQWQDLFILVP